MKNISMCRQWENLEFFNAHKFCLGLGAKFWAVTATLHWSGRGKRCPGEIAAFDQAIGQDETQGYLQVSPTILVSFLQSTSGKAGIPVVTIPGGLNAISASPSLFQAIRSSAIPVQGIRLKHLGWQGKVRILSLPGVQMFDDREAGSVQPSLNIPESSGTGGDTKAIRSQRSTWPREHYAAYTDL